MNELCANQCGNLDDPRHSKSKIRHDPRIYRPTEIVSLDPHTPFLGHLRRACDGHLRRACDNFRWLPRQVGAGQVGATQGREAQVRAAQVRAAQVRAAQVRAGDRPGTTTSEAERIAQLERENRELRRANTILKQASAFFAAEIDRPQR